MAEIIQVPVGKLAVNRHALRLEVENEDLDDLSASIRRIGIIVPLLCTQQGDSFSLVAGHRRLLAATRVGLSTVPCIVTSSEEAVTAETAIAENLFRTDLTPVEQASAIKDVLDQKIMDVPEVARVVHRSEYWVRAQLDLLTWPGDVLEAIHNGKISVSAASNLALITDSAYRGFLVSNAIESGATARTTAAWLQAWRAALPQEKAVEQSPVSGPERVTPALPQAPCLVCTQMFRTDGLAMVMICTNCINSIRAAAVQG